MWEIAGGKLNNVTPRTAFLSKDKTGKRVVRDYLTYLSEGIVDLVNIFQSEIICIGGGISNEGERILKPVRTAINKYSYARREKKQTEVQLAKLGNGAGIIGAALLWKNN